MKHHHAAIHPQRLLADLDSTVNHDIGKIEIKESTPIPNANKDFIDYLLVMIVDIGIPGGALAAILTIDFMNRLIKIGKGSRGVSKDDPYFLGDFLRGAVRLPEIIARKGALLRRGNFKEYKLGDFSCGAITSLYKYVKRSKAKLCSAITKDAITDLIGPPGIVLVTIAELIRKKKKRNHK
jgi:hypothetical protein